MVASQHLIAHEMTTDEYRELFQLDVTASTACTETRERASMLEQIAEAGPGRVYLLAECRQRSRGGGRLAVRRPDLIVDWETEAPENPDSYTIGEHSRGKVSWRCRSCGDGWRETPKGPRPWTRCPACVRRRIVGATVWRNRQPPLRARSLGRGSA